MSRASAWFVHASVLLAGATGVIYGWMRYFAVPTEEFSVVNHPWQPEFKALHILLVPLLLFGCGLLWRGHVWARIRSGAPQRRSTGLALAGLLLPMALSGYLLQVAADPTWREGWIWTHGLSSSLWLLIYAWHQLSRPSPPPG
jgi:hypothetical protein